jgi:hypothetical protein
VSWRSASPAARPPRWPAAIGGALLPVAAAVCLAACAGPPAGPPATAAAGSGPPVGGGISREQDRQLPPVPPPGLRAAVTGGRIVLSWQPVGLEILASYRVRRLEPGGPAILGDVPADPARELARSGIYTHAVAGPPAPGVHTYAVSALDRDGNESAPARVSFDVRP